MNLIIDEAIRCVHFAPCLAAGTFKRVLSFERGAAVKHGNISMPTIWHSRSPETREPPELSWIDLACDVGGHVKSRVIRPSNVILRKGQRLGRHGDLDETVHSFSRNLR